MMVRILDNKLSEKDFEVWKRYKFRDPREGQVAVVGGLYRVRPEGRTSCVGLPALGTTDAEN